MVAGPPPPPTVPHGGPPGLAVKRREPLRCTHSRAVPHVDMTVAVTYGAAGALMAIGGGALLMSSDDYNRLMGGAYVFAGAISVGFATPFYLSARSGYRKVAACRTADR